MIVRSAACPLGVEALQRWYQMLALLEPSIRCTWPREQRSRPKVFQVFFYWVLNSEMNIFSVLAQCCHSREACPDHAVSAWSSVPRPNTVRSCHEGYKQQGLKLVRSGQWSTESDSFRARIFRVLGRQTLPPVHLQSGPAPSADQTASAWLGAQPGSIRSTLRLLQ